MVRPERSIRIGSRRSSPLRGACGVQNRYAVLSNCGALIKLPTPKNTSGPTRGPDLFWRARRDWLELPNGDSRGSAPFSLRSNAQNADAFCRTAALIFIQNTPNEKGPPMGTLYHLARPERFELPTAWFVARYSIQLSYGRVVWSENCGPRL